MNGRAKISSMFLLLLVLAPPPIQATGLGDFPHTFGNMQKILAGDTIAVIATKSDITSDATQDSDSNSWLATHTWVITDFQQDADTNTFDATKTFVNSRGGMASIISNLDVVNTTTETQLIGFIIPTASLTAGMFFRIEAGGFCGDTLAYPTMTWRVRMGNSSLSRALLDSVVLTPSSVGTSRPWMFHGFGTIRTTGETGTVIESNFLFPFGIGAFATAQVRGGTITAAQTVNTTADNILEVTFQWSAAHAKNTLSCYNAVIEIVKP